MAILCPSILAADQMNLGRDIQMIKESGCRWVHVDIMDGLFVPNLSFGYSTVKALRPVTDMVLDVHLMIDRPIRYVEQFCKAGADYLTIHVEADTRENTLAALDMIRSFGVKCGVVLKPNTPAEEAEPFLSKCDLVLVMTVEPGVGGQKFMADMMSKVTKLRKMLDEVNPACHLEVDGGVDLSNSALCVQSGADVLVAGSSYFRATDKALFVNAMEA